MRENGGQAGTCESPSALRPSEGGSGTFLCQNAVTPAVKDGYTRVISWFLFFCSYMNLPLSSDPLIDRAMCAFADECFAEGIGPSVGERLLSAWCDAFVEYRPGSFPGFVRALRAWRRLRPKFSRHPLPWALLSGIACVVAAHTDGGQGAAISLVLMFDTYMRPYELLQLRVGDVCPPVDNLASWIVTICPFDRRRPTKTGVFDDSVRLDSSLRPHVALLLQHWLHLRLSAGATPSDFLFEFSHAELAGWFSSAVSFLHLDPWKFTLYSNRHGGASEDRARNARSAQDVQRRGRWLSESSVRRYEQMGRLQVVLSRTPPSILLFCQKCLAHLVPLILHPTRFARPTSAPWQAPLTVAEEWDE